MDINRHEYFMQRCLQLASQGMGRVAPNPMVGAVIVFEDIIIGEGYHQEFGKAHAEVNAITSVKDQELLKHATIYVNLEPCAHHGKTPPCADLIVEKGIPRVVIGCTDSFAKVAGKGIQHLKQNGVEVITDVLHDEAREFNKRFFTFHENKRPYVVLKWAQSKDGFIDRIRNGEKGVHWITGKKEQRLVHQWRSEESAILVGKNTVLNDDPSLTVREVSGRNPLRIVIDSQGSLPLSYRIFNDEAPTLQYNSLLEETVNQHHTRVKIPFDDKVVAHILNNLHQREIQSLIVEGGAQTLQHFLDAGLWDEARIFEGDAEFGQGLKAPVVGNLAWQFFKESNLTVIRKNGKMSYA
jgi:diaminohydroxyphosphoribosylaminopyrimidine deaminase/5-amino-6-(5-phosphoribosylamino)uracil reductase